MNYKLFASSAVPQLNRLFANVNSDNKACHLVKLNAGFTEADLNKCLNYQAATGAGYMFDTALAASSGICTVLATGSNCVRTIAADKITVSDCLLTAVAEGVPTHLILGGILPICLQVGTDVTLLYPDLNIKYDPNGYKTQVIIQAFSIPLTNMWADLGSWMYGTEIVAFDNLKFAKPSFSDYVNITWAITGDADFASDNKGINLGLTGVMTVTPTVFSPSLSFTIEFMYHQTSAAELAEFSLIRMGTTLTNRFAITMDRSNGGGLLIYGNVGGGSTDPRVVRPAANYAALKTTVPVKVKYVYNADTTVHTISVDGTVIDTFTAANVYPVASGMYITGGYGAGASAACLPIIDQYGVRQGAY